LLRGSDVQLEHFGRPDVDVGADVRELKTWRRDANDGIGPRIEVDRSTRDARIGSEAPDPQSVADQDNRTAAGLVLFRQKRSSKGRPHTQYVEEVPRNAGGGKLVGLAAIGETERLGGESGDTRESLAMRDEKPRMRIRKRAS